MEAGAYSLAAEKIAVAEHILDNVYPIVEEPKLLGTIIDNIFQALDASVSSLLSPKKFKDFSSKFSALENVRLRYGITKQGMLFLKNLHGLVEARKNSTTEFSRKGILVICSNNFDLRMLSYDYVIDQLKKAKLFIQKMHYPRNGISL